MITRLTWIVRVGKHGSLCCSSHDALRRNSLFYDSCGVGVTYAVEKIVVELQRSALEQLVRTDDFGGRWRIGSYQSSAPIQHHSFPARPGIILKLSAILFFWCPTWQFYWTVWHFPLYACTNSALQRRVLVLKSQNSK